MATKYQATVMSSYAGNPEYRREVTGTNRKAVMDVAKLLATSLGVSRIELERESTQHPCHQSTEYIFASPHGTGTPRWWSLDKNYPDTLVVHEKLNPTNNDSLWDY